MKSRGFRLMCLKKNTIAAPSAVMDHVKSVPKKGLHHRRKL
jgi:hypothetical protein